MLCTIALQKKLWPKEATLQVYGTKSIYFKWEILKITRCKPIYEHL